MEITTSTIITATPEQIWQALLNFPNYTVWNPFIKNISGDVQLHKKIKVQIDKMTFTPTIIELIDNKKLVWIGRLGIKGLFDGRHSFEITVLSPNECLFSQSEKFSGLLAPLFKNKLKTNTKQGFIAMNQALKELIENKIM
ncbi:SRPBCC domain-containing protein [Myroides injenensis]|uniref:SRPBCC domain-containing protein n=1 Tax=Myroides injenensis TaxID=1183151 RepID=UPI000289A8CA|nr:SRPBCC domain-containing protein [Myroides injenensis]